MITPQTSTMMQNVAHVIQLSVAPVFLVSGVGALLAVLTNRLGRIIDRARRVEADLPSATTERLAVMQRELGTLSRRVHLINWAIGLCTVCALLICFVIASLFVGTLWSWEVSRVIVFLFIAAMVSLAGGLTTFLREIFVATTAARLEMRWHK